jgi:hypothetical protein
MLRSVGKIRDGEDILIIFDSGVVPIHADIVTEISEEDGIVRMSFAAVTQDGDGVPKADVAVRLRMKSEIAWSLCRSLRALEGE